LIYAGCDLGILSAKAAVIRDGEVLAFEILPYRNLPRQAAVEVMDRAFAAAGVTREQVEYCLATGFGKNAVACADGIVAHIMCLQRAILKLNPKVRTVIDVGGHSFTAFNMYPDGRIAETSITDMCAAGTGKYLEVMADALETPLEELSRSSLSSTNPLPITHQCVVLAESDLITYVNDGHDPLDIFAGIGSSVAARIAGMVKRIAIGVARHPIVARELEKELGLKLAGLGGVDPRLLGAYGAAILASEGEPSL
jgi:predicted CoA-substrate-specific enzyme activase